MAEIGLFEAMYTARSIRRIKTDPVPDEIITKVLDAAIRAPSGSNAHAWVFIVVKDAEKRKQLGALYHKIAAPLSQLYEDGRPPPHMEPAKYERWLRSVRYLPDHMGEAPVLIVPCLKATVWSNAASLPDDIKAVASPTGTPFLFGWKSRVAFRLATASTRSSFARPGLFTKVTLDTCRQSLSGRCIHDMIGR